MLWGKVLNTRRGKGVFGQKWLKRTIVFGRGKLIEELESMMNW
jgi:hypothetical protein